MQPFTGLQCILACTHTHLHACLNKPLACIASISTRVREKGREQKKKEWRGRGRGEKETIVCKPHDFEKLRLPTNAASDWWGAGSVGEIAINTSIKPGKFCLRTSQIWSDLICSRRLQILWTDIYLNGVRTKVYQI